MSESVTTLGKIPANVEVYTRAQTDAAISGSVAAISGVVCGVTVEQWETINDIIQDAGGVAMKADVASVAQINGSGILFGSGTSGIGELKVYNPSGNWELVLTESCFCGGLAGAEDALNISRNIYEYSSGDVYGMVSGAFDGSRLAACFDNFVGSGWSDFTDALSGIIDTAVSGWTSSGDLVYKDDFANMRNGSYVTQDYLSVALCGVIVEGNLCEKLQDCSWLTDKFTEVSEDLSGVSGLTTAIQSLTGTIGDLASAVCGISEAITDIRDEVSGLPSRIETAINELSGIDRETKDIVIDAAVNAISDMNRDIDPSVRTIGSDLELGASGMSGLDSGLEDLSDAASESAVPDASGAAGEVSGAEAASAVAAAALSNEASEVEAIGDFVP